MLRPFLIIGVGGSGGKTLRGITYQSQLKLQQVGWKSGIPAVVAVPSFRHADRAGRSRLPGAVPASSAVQGTRLDGRHLQHASTDRSRARTRRINAVHQDIERQLPDPRYVKVDVTKGAGQFRAVGRAVALASTKEIASAARGAIARLSDASALAELRTLGQLLRARGEGGDGSPTVHRHLVGRRRVGRRPVPRHHRGREVDGEAASVVQPVLQHPVRPRRLRPAQRERGHAGQRAGLDRRDDERLLDEFAVRFDARAPQAARASRPSYGDAMDRVGAAYPFIVGRSNSKVTFEDQSAGLQRRRHEPDRLDHRRAGAGRHDRVLVGQLAGARRRERPRRRLRPCEPRAPLAALLLDGLRTSDPRARDVPRVLRRAIRTFGHRSDAARALRRTTRCSRSKTEREWIESEGRQAPTSASSATCGSTRRPKPTIRSSMPCAPTTSSPRSRRSSTTASISASAKPGPFDKSGGLDLSVWTDRMLNEYSVRVAASCCSATSDAARSSLEEWIEARCRRTSCTRSPTYVAQVGLPAVVAMLGAPRPHAASTADGLEAEAHQLRRLGESAFARSSPTSCVRRRTSSPSVPTRTSSRHGIERLTQALEWASEARLRQSASGLRRRTARRLPRAAARVTSKARSRRSASGWPRGKTADNRDNEYEFWPTRSDHTVPRKYEPAPNERLLVEHTEYPAEFERLVRASVEGSDVKYQDAILTVIDAAARGRAARDG